VGVRRGGIEPGQGEQVVDQAFHAIGLRSNDPHDPLGIVGVAAGAADQ